MPFQRNQLLQTLAEQLKLNYRFKNLDNQNQEAHPEIPLEMSYPGLKWQQDFLSLLASLDVEQIENKLQEIESDHPAFYTKLNPWVQAFAFDKIAQWLRQPENQS